MSPQRQHLIEISRRLAGRPMVCSFSPSIIVVCCLLMSSGVLTVSATTKLPIPAESMKAGVPTPLSYVKFSVQPTAPSDLNSVTLGRTEDDHSLLISLARPLNRHSVMNESVNSNIHSGIRASELFGKNSSSNNSAVGALADNVVMGDQAEVNHSPSAFADSYRRENDLVQDIVSNGPVMGTSLVRISPASGNFAGGVIIHFTLDSGPSQDKTTGSNNGVIYSVSVNAAPFVNISGDRYNMTQIGSSEITARAYYTDSQGSITESQTSAAGLFNITKALDPLIMPNSTSFTGHPVNFTCVNQFGHLLPIYVELNNKYTDNDDTHVNMKTNINDNMEDNVEDVTTHKYSPFMQATKNNNATLYAYCNIPGKYVLTCTYTDDIQVNHTTTRQVYLKPVRLSGPIFDPPCGTRLLASSLYLRFLLPLLNDSVIQGSADLPAELHSRAHHTGEVTTATSSNNSRNSDAYTYESTLRMEGLVINGELSFIHSAAPKDDSAQDITDNNTKVNLNKQPSTLYLPYHYSFLPNLILPNAEIPSNAFALELPIVLRATSKGRFVWTAYPELCTYGMYVPGNRRTSYFLGRPTCAHYRNDADQVGESCVVHVRASLARCLYMNGPSYGATNVYARVIGPTVVLTVVGGSSYEWQDDYFKRVKRCVNLPLPSQAQNLQVKGQHEEGHEQADDFAWMPRTDLHNLSASTASSIRTLISSDAQIDTTVPGFMLSPVVNEMDDKFTLICQWELSSVTKFDTKYTSYDPEDSGTRPSVAFTYTIGFIQYHAWMDEVDDAYVYYVRNTDNCSNSHLDELLSIVTSPFRTDYNSPHVNTPHHPLRDNLYWESTLGNKMYGAVVIFIAPGNYRSCIRQSNGTHYMVGPSSAHAGQSGIRVFADPWTQISLHHSRNVVTRLPIESFSQLQSVLNNEHMEPCGGRIDERQANTSFPLFVTTLPSRSAYLTAEASQRKSPQVVKEELQMKAKKLLDRLIHANDATVEMNSRTSKARVANDEDNDSKKKIVFASVNGAPWSAYLQENVYSLPPPGTLSAPEGEPRVLAVSVSLGPLLAVSRTCIFYLPPSTAAHSHNGIHQAATATTAASSSASHRMATDWRYSFYRLSSSTFSQNSGTSASNGDMPGESSRTFAVILTLHGTFHRSALVDSRVAVLRMSTPSYPLSAPVEEMVSNQTVSLTPAYQFNYTRALTDNILSITLPVHTRCQNRFMTSNAVSNEADTDMNEPSETENGMPCVEVVPNEYIHVYTQIDGQQEVQLSPVNVALSPLSLSMEPSSHCRSGYGIGHSCVCADKQSKMPYLCAATEGDPVYLDGEDEVDISEEQVVSSETDLTGALISLIIVIVILTVVIIGLIWFICKQLRRRKGLTHADETRSLNCAIS